MPNPNPASPLFEGYVSFTKFAEDCGVSTRTVLRWHNRGLPVTRRGNLRLIEVEKARAWLAGGETGSLAPAPRRRRANGVRP